MVVEDQAGMSQPTPQTQPAAVRRILLVDDEPRARKMIATLFERHGYAVTRAEEFEEAGALLAHRRYDLLCLDLDLSGLAGLEGLELIDEARLRNPEMRIVVETGNGSPRVHEACQERGARGVFVKGSPLVELEKMVERCFGETS